MRRSSLYLIFLLVSGVFLMVMAFHAGWRQQHDQPVLLEKKALVAQLGITDLCLFTEAAYTRHPSQADRHTPFQDSPLTFEHFPSGSLISPPPTLKGPHAPLD
jgi:hypothetical protein